MYERDRDAAQTERLAVLSAADKNAVDSASWHKSEAFRRHKRHGAAEAVGALRAHQDAERESLEKAQMKARLALGAPMRPEEREDAKAALAGLERDDPWMDDGTPTGRRWASEATMESELAGATKLLGEVAAAAAKELAGAETMLREAKKQLQAEIELRRDIVEDCKALA